MSKKKKFKIDLKGHTEFMYDEVKDYVDQIANDIECEDKETLKDISFCLLGKIIKNLLHAYVSLIPTEPDNPDFNPLDDYLDTLNPYQFNEWVEYKIVDGGFTAITKIYGPEDK